MYVSGVIGLIAGIIMVACAVVLGGNLTAFVNVPSIVATVGFTFALHLMTWGVRDSFRTGQLLCVVVKRGLPSDLAHHDVALLLSLVPRLYLMGAFVTLIGLIQILAALAHLEKLGPAVSVSLIPLFYAFILAEFLVRPALLRIEAMLACS